jgi:hypothetical protein
MIDRRSFLTGSVAMAAALAGAPTRAGARGRADVGAPLPDIVLVDRHLAGSETFAAQARARGLGVLEFTSDAAGVWMRELEPRLRAGPLAIAGLTSAATLFCLDFLARDYGARTVRRVAGAAAVTWLIASSPALRAALAPAHQHSRQGRSDA